MIVAILLLLYGALAVWLGYTASSPPHAHRRSSREHGGEGRAARGEAGERAAMSGNDESEADVVRMLAAMWPCPVPTRESAILLRKVMNEVARIRGATGKVITTAFVHPGDLKACGLPRTFTWLGVTYRECGELRPGDVALLVATKDGATR